MFTDFGAQCRDYLHSQLPIYWVPVLKSLYRGLGFGVKDGLGFRALSPYMIFYYL